jgi:hypothetical protein
MKDHVFEVHIRIRSLIQIESRTRTVPSAFAASPAIVEGITRGWYYQAPSASWNPTYLGAVDDEPAGR